MNGDEKSKNGMGKCKSEGIVYRINCTTCKKNNITSVYIGESGRSSYSRGKEHQAAYARGDMKSPMYKHWGELHQDDDEETEFSMTVIKNYQRPLQRQIGEAVRIRNVECDYLLNSKNEWNGQKLPRIVIEVKDKVEQVEYQGTKQKKRRLEQPTYRNNSNEQEKLVTAEPTIGQVRTIEPSNTASVPEQQDPVQEISFGRPTLRKISMGAKRKLPKGWKGEIDNKQPSIKEALCKTKTNTTSKKQNQNLKTVASIVKGKRTKQLSIKDMMSSRLITSKKAINVCSKIEVKDCNEKSETEVNTDRETDGKSKVKVKEGWDPGHREGGSHNS